MSERVAEHRVGLRGRILHLILRAFRARPAMDIWDEWFERGCPVWFDTQIGEHHPHDVAIRGDGVISSGRLPDELECPSTFYIYASNAEWRLTCHGFGPDDELLTVARRHAENAAAGLVCAGGCSKVVREVFSGWSCEWYWGLGQFITTCAVELEVSCISL